MTNQPKNQPTFHINQVGNLNTGDVTVQGDQVGFQSNYSFPDPKQTEATYAPCHHSIILSGKQQV